MWKIDTDTIKRITTLILAVIFAFTAFSSFAVTSMAVTQVEPMIHVIIRYGEQNAGGMLQALMYSPVPEEWGMWLGASIEFLRMGAEQLLGLETWSNGPYSINPFTGQIEVNQLGLNIDGVPAWVQGFDTWDHYYSVVTSVATYLNTTKDIGNWKYANAPKDFEVTAGNVSVKMSYEEYIELERLAEGLLKDLVAIKIGQMPTFTNEGENYLLRYGAETNKGIAFQGADGFLARYDVFNSSNALSVNYISAAHGGVIANGSMISDVPNFKTNTRYVPYFVHEGELYINSNRTLQQIQTNLTEFPDFPIMGFTFVKSIDMPTSGTLGGSVAEYMNPVGEVNSPTNGWATAQNTRFLINYEPPPNGYMMNPVSPSKFYLPEIITVSGQQRINLRFTDRGQFDYIPSQDFNILLPNNFIKMSTGEHVSWQKPFIDSNSPVAIHESELKFIVVPGGTSVPIFDYIVSKAVGTLETVGEDVEIIFPVPHSKKIKQNAIDKGLVGKTPPITIDDEGIVEVDGISLEDLEALLLGIDIALNNQLGVQLNILSTLRTILTTIVNLPQITFSFFSGILNSIWTTLKEMPGKIWELVQSLSADIWGSALQIYHSIQQLPDRIRDTFVYTLDQIRFYSEVIYYNTIHIAEFLRNLPESIYHFFADALARIIDELKKLTTIEEKEPISGKGDFDVKLVGIFDKFPFSLPFDFYNIVTIFVEKPKTPVFDIPISNREDGDYQQGDKWYSSDGRLKNFDIDYTINIDLTRFDWVASIIRWFVYVVFVVFLIFRTNNLIGRN
ncbi:MAG: hypothetical protein FWH05_09295 [Oscillospiraceae bacterium]|nr:hypothetical protein [Oscillospiraceae bacterium]